MVGRCLRLYRKLDAVFAYCPSATGPNFNPVVKSKVLNQESLGRRHLGVQPILAAEGTPRQSHRFRPESPGRMRDFHNPSNRSHEFVELRIGHNQGRCDL